MSLRMQNVLCFQIKTKKMIDRHIGKQVARNRKINMNHQKKITFYFFKNV